MRVRVCLTVPNMADDVSVTLSSEEALVLFEVLHRWEESGFYERADLQPGELTALRAISGGLESLLVEPFEENYRDLVDQARQRLKGRSDA